MRARSARWKYVAMTRLAPLLQGVLFLGVVLGRLARSLQISGRVWSPDSVRRTSAAFCMQAFFYARRMLYGGLCAGGFVPAGCLTSRLTNLRTVRHPFVWSRRWRAPLMSGAPPWSSRPPIHPSSPSHPITRCSITPVPSNASTVTRWPPASPSSVSKWRLLVATFRCPHLYRDVGGSSGVEAELLPRRRFGRLRS